jgi:hypothetical protein
VRLARKSLGAFHVDGGVAAREITPHELRWEEGYI